MLKGVDSEKRGGRTHKRRQVTKNANKGLGIIKLNIFRFVEILKSARTRIKSATDSLRGSGETKPGGLRKFVQL